MFALKQNKSKRILGMTRLLSSIILIFIISDAYSQVAKPVYENIYTSRKCTKRALADNSTSQDVDFNPFIDTVKVYKDYITLSGLKANYRETTNNGTRMYVAQIVEDKETSNFVIALSKNNNLIVFYSIDGAPDNYKFEYYIGDQLVRVKNEILDKKLISKSVYTMLPAVVNMHRDQEPQITILDTNPKTDDVEIYGRHLNFNGKRYNHLISSDGIDFYCDTTENSTDIMKCFIHSSPYLIKASINVKTETSTAYYWIKGDEVATIKHHLDEKKRIEEQEQQSQHYQQTHDAQMPKWLQVMGAVSQALVNGMQTYMNAAYGQQGIKNNSRTNSVNNYTPQRNNNSASTSNHSSKWEFSYVRATTGYTKSGSTTTIYVYVNNKNPRELRTSFSESKNGTTRQATKQIYNNTDIGMKYKYYILNFGTAYYFN